MEKIPAQKQKKEPESFDRKAAQAALQMAILGFLATADPSAAMAGKREAVRVAEGIKVSEHVMPKPFAGDTPKDDPKKRNVKWRIKN